MCCGCGQQQWHTDMNKVTSMKKMFLLGSERSGTNLLRVLLGNHSQVSAPPPIHLCDVLMNRRELYYPYEKATIQKLVPRIQDYVNHTFSDWKLTLDPAAFFDTYTPSSFLDIFDGVYTEKARADGKTAYFSKDNHLHHYALGLKLHFPECHLVYIYRDPRDQVASWLKNPFHLHTAYQAAMKWKEDQAICLALKEFYNVNLVQVKYEDLIADTPGVMTRVLTELGLTVEEQCFQTSGKNTEAKKHVLWKNLDKKVISDNHGKYREVLTDEQVNLVETLCKQEMGPLGYTLDTQANFDFGHPYVWKVRELAKIWMSRRKHNQEKGFEVIIDKNRYVNEVFGRP